MPPEFGDKKIIGESPGGSTLLQYDTPGAREFGFPDEAPAINEREAVYNRFFGESSTVYHEVLPHIPHIDVYTYPAGQKNRKWCTLVTGGMSDSPMGLSKEAAAQGAPRRVELIFYCSEPRPEYLETLRFLARFPHAYRTWVGSGHTIPNGNPPAPIWNCRELDTMLLMPTIVGPDRSLAKELSIGGDPVEFLWVVPLSRAECELKLAKGYEAILDLFGRKRHPHVFTGDRASYL